MGYADRLLYLSDALSLRHPLSLPALSGCRHYLCVHRLTTNQQTARDVGEAREFLDDALGLLTQLARRTQNHGADAGLRERERDRETGGCALKDKLKGRLKMFCFVFANAEWKVR